MKKIQILLSLFFLVLVQISFAQKVLHDATLNYSISMQSADGKPAATPLEGAMLAIYLKGYQSRSEMISGLGTESSIYDSKSGKGYILKEYSGQKLMISMDRSNWNQKNKFYHTTKFTLDNKEQVIGGFKTKKASTVLPDGKELIVYYSSEFIAGNKFYNNAFSLLPGIPVQYEVVSGNLRFVYSLIKIDQEIVPSSKFEIPKTGYRVMTYAENQQLKKGDNK